MTKSVRVRVDDRHYEGAGHTPYDNPTANAIRERLKKEKGEVALWHGHVRIGAKIYDLPEEASSAAVMWDVKEERRTYEFQLSNKESDYDNQTIQKRT
jgi:hypothetical protein